MRRKAAEMGTVTVTLARDSLCSPWGFRLQGGAEFAHAPPLTIAKV